MKLITITIIALGLAADAFSVSVASGVTYKRLGVKHALTMAAFFGAFQAIMPLLGALASLTIKAHIETYDHWIAFALLAAIGIKMIYESFKIKSIDQKSDPTGIAILLVLSVATSIDALAAGITLPLLKVPIATAVIIIGLVTFALSYCGVFIGKRFGHFFESKIEAAGGIILVALGTKILLQHLLA